MFLEDLEFWHLGSCFSEDLGFWALAHVFRGPKVLDPGSCFQWMKDFWILAHVFLRTKGFLGFGSCFQ